MNKPSLAAQAGITPARDNLDRVQKASPARRAAVMMVRADGACGSVPDAAAQVGAAGVYTQIVVV